MIQSLRDWDRETLMFVTFILEQLHSAEKYAKLHAGDDGGLFVI